LVTFAGLVAFIPLFTYFYFARDLKSKETIMNRNDTGLVLLDKNDKPFFSFYEARQKTLISLSDIPAFTRQAIISTEDREFYQHPGFSLKGIFRSILFNITQKDLSSSGGSTITQQLVKNALLTPRKSFLRKYQEIVLAQEIERRYSKDEILSMYLNSVYFGSGAFGVEEAAQTYFGEEARNLTLGQSSLLAAVLPAPSRLSQDKEWAKARQNLVLQNMLEQGYINKEQKEAAEAENIVFSKHQDDFNRLAPHFALLVRDQLIEKYGEEEVSRSGFKVKTTLDLSWQEFAEDAVRKQVVALTRSGVSNGGAVSIDPKTGEVRVLVGSADWNNDKFGKFNIAIASRQPGSSFKPLIYAGALEERAITASTVLKDEPTTFTPPHAPPYKPENYDKKFRGPLLPRRALANSLNVPSVEVMDKLGLDRGMGWAKKFGITTLRDSSNYGLSLVLGTAEVKPIELTNAYASFANGGYKNDITTILEIKDKSDAVVYIHKPNPQRVISEETAFIISSILSDQAARAEVFGKALNISRPAAVKTGTSQEYRDSWTVGYTPSLATSVWVGNNDNKPMNRVAGSLGAAPIWRSLMEKFLAGTPVEGFKAPEGIVSRSICKNNGLLLKEATSSASVEFYIKGTEPTQKCQVFKAPEATISIAPLP
ncbi:MAG: PBP1A family penicillin-binding protein, partial [bacterium]|nr:PBP1A family penicillin-binding protein [bacterium]